MYQVPFPSQDDLLRLKHYATDFSFNDRDFMSEEVISNLLFDDRFFEIKTWVRILAQRLHETNFSFVMSTFYFEKGIDDSPWHDETGKIFPNFSDQDFLNKEGFDYYSEFFLYRSFSALDTIGHILSLNYEMTWTAREKISFKASVNKLRRSDFELYNRIVQITDTDCFKEISKLRNDSTHNIPSGQVDSGVTKYPNGLIALGMGNYIITKDRYDLMLKFKDAVFQLIETVKSTFKTTSSDPTLLPLD